jgi:hypothetical protein
MALRSAAGMSSMKRDRIAKASSAYELAPGIEVGAADLRIALRQVEAAIGRQAAEQDVAEGLGGRLAAGGDVAHGSRRVENENPGR